MIKGVDNLLKWYKMQNMPYWRITTVTKDSEGGNFIAESGELPEDKYNALEQGYKLLSEAVELLENGSYKIIVRNTATQAKSLATIIYKHGDTAVSGANPSTPNYQSNLITREDAQKMAHDAMEYALVKFQYDLAIKKIADLERELRLKQNEDSPISGVVKRIEPFIEPMMNHLFPKPSVMQPTKIAAVGYNTEQAQEFDLAKTQKLKDLIERWQEIDNDHFVEVIEKIVTTAESDKNSYDMYRKMLIGK